MLERMVLQPESLHYWEHVARYRFVQSRLQPGWVLDIACGTAYGAAMLAGTLSVQVVGVDLHEGTLRQARQAHSSQHLHFLAASGPCLPFRDHSFQVVASLETIEHISDDRTFLQELNRVLDPGGICIISTPNRAYSEGHHIENPYHVREYYEDQLSALLRPYFSQVETYYQGYSSQFHEQVRGYTTSIQREKRDRSKALQFVIDSVYRPVKQAIPPVVTNHFIRKILGLSYPTATPGDIVISREPVEDSNVLIAVCSCPIAAG